MKFLFLMQVDYVTVPGWLTSTESVRTYEDLPENARKYVELIEDRLGLPGIFSTSPLFLLKVYFYLCIRSAVDWRGQGSRLNDPALLRTVEVRDEREKRALNHLCPSLFLVVVETR